MSITKLETSLFNVCNALDRSKFLELAIKMKNEDKIKTDPEFTKKFMFAFDHNVEKFCVNIELLIEHEVYDRKDNAKRALKKHFTDGTDYRGQSTCSSTERSENNKALHGGNNKEIIMLTPDCFKSMCLIAGSDAGKIVRQYYLDLEQVSKMYIFNELRESERLRLRAEKLHQQNIRKHRYFKFGKKGPTFYIIMCGLEYADGVIRLKFGVAGCPRDEKYKNSHHSIDSRLAEHRTLWPQLQVLFVVYTRNAQLLENFIKVSYQNKINPNGHEIMENVNPTELIQTVNNCLGLLDICQTEPSYRIEENLEMYNQKALIPIREQAEISEGQLSDKEQIDEEKNEVDENEEEIKNDMEQFQVINIANFSIPPAVFQEPSVDEAIDILRNLKAMTCAQLRGHLEKYQQPIAKLKEKLQKKLQTYIVEILMRHDCCPPHLIPKIIPPTPHATTGTRKCAVCKQRLHISKFWVKISGVKGRDNTCSECRNDVRRRDRARKWSEKTCSD
jgi:hypothetical protein